MERTRKIRRLLLLSSLLLLSPGVCLKAQVLGVKTNALAWGTASFNVGLEWGFARHWSFDVDGIYNPFSWNDGKKTHIWGFQPEVRWWPAHRFAGHFLGVHGHYAMYDWGLHKYRYKGQLWGTGVSYGYALMLSRSWNVEVNAGFGYTRLNDDYKYDRRDASITYPAETREQWGLSRAGISFTYFFK